MNWPKLVAVLGTGGVLLVGAFVVVTKVVANRGFADTPYPEVVASSDPVVIEKGRYLAFGPAECSSCHVTTEQSRKLGPGGFPALTGGLEFDMPGFGRVRTPNLTSDEETGIGRWSDAELARMIRYGVDRHGNASLEMKFVGGNMSDEDLAAIVSYLRASEPVSAQRARSEHSFIYTAIVAWAFDPLASRPPAPAKSPPSAPTVGRGEYLANGPANCVGCHSAINPADFSLSRKFGGAEAVPNVFDPSMEFAAPNITTGGRLKDWTEQAFVRRFRAGKLIADSGMPWGSFAQMTDDDLRAVYRYLRSLPPIDYDPGPSQRTAGWKPEG